MKQSVRGMSAALIAMVFAFGLAHAQSTPPTKTYIVQLGDSPAGSATGVVAGLPSARRAAGDRFDPKTPLARAYMGYLDIKRNEVLTQVPGITVQRVYKHAFNGFSAQLTTAQATQLMATTNVISVVPVEVRHPITVSTPRFLGLSAPGGLWSQSDAQSRALKGDDVIIGVVDTGIWPEDTSFSDKVAPGTGIPVPYNSAGTVVYGPPPAKWNGICQTGPGFTAAMCNNKLIGARFYELSYYQLYGVPLSPTAEFLSPRDGLGHGSHTASTAGGNSNVPATLNGQLVGSISGMAPRARLAVYKVCWRAQDPFLSGCQTDNLVAAIDDAVADGVDVINFSISGATYNVPDPVEVAMLNAAAAGVFVSTAAGNDGPGTENVNHRWPWTATIAASTHDRSFEATVKLGNGYRASGPSYPRSGGPLSAPMILSRDAGVKPYAELTPDEQNALTHCFLPEDQTPGNVLPNAALDPGKVSGKIVVCLRGGNPLVNKGTAVAGATGAGLVILNTPTSLATTLLVPQALPTVHLTAASYDAVWNYGGSGNASASFTVPSQVIGGVPAPVMASFSSSGPNYSDYDVLKPDLTAPGVSVIAAFTETLTVAQHDQVAVGTYTPHSATEALDGTSMATPHVAGVAALLKQAHPQWSPAAIKSALVTTAGPVKLATGQIDPNRFGYGGGHINPNAAADPGLVYDIGSADYLSYLCVNGFTPPAALGTCAYFYSPRPQLNLPEMTGTFAKTGTFTRTVTNVTHATATYVAAASVPGWALKVTPSTLRLAPGESAPFTVVANQTGTDTADWSFGNLTWSDGVHHVRSPVSIRSAQFRATPEITDTRASNVRMFTISAVTKPIPSARGLIPRTVKQGYVRTGQTQCFEFVTLDSPSAIRFQLRNSETDGGASTDLALKVSLNGTNVASSQKPGSDEQVTIMRPAGKATYNACVEDVSDANGKGAAFKLSYWQLKAGAAPDNLFAFVTPYLIFDNSPTTAGVQWSLPKTSGDYLGMVEFFDAQDRVLGGTLVSVQVP